MQRRILVVDDEADMVSMIKMRLEANGYEVIAAYDGEEGLKKIEKDHPDIILLDIMMPKKDGYTLLRELKCKETTRSIPVIALTAKPGMRDLFDIEGINDYIVKPFEAEELLFRIKKGLKNDQKNISC